VWLPRLHLVTDDRRLAAPGWTARVASAMEAGGSAVAVHVRGPRTPGATLYERVAALRADAARTGATLVVNDRVDVALASGVGVVQLGRRSLPVDAARGVLGPEARIGVSAHTGAEAAAAARDGADFVVMGTIFPTPSHRGLPATGISGLRDAVRAARPVPVVAIGGIDPPRTGAAIEAGAHGVAVVRGVWDAPDAAAATLEYLKAIEDAIHA